MSRSCRTLPIVALLLMTALAAPVALAPDQSAAADAASAELVPFLGVVGQYRSGRTGLATVQALGWTRQDIENFRRALSDLSDAVETPSAGGALTTADIEAAVLLHTEACLAFADVGDGTGAWLHLDAAQSLLNWLEQLSVLRPGLRVRSLLVPRREWYVAAVTALNGVRMPDLGEPLATTALRDYPADPGVLFAAAVSSEGRAHIQEQLGGLGAQYGVPSRTGPVIQEQPGSHQVLQFLEQRALEPPGVRALRLQALRCLADVLAASPGLAEARLRQGRLLSLVGRDDEALAELADLAGHAEAVEHRYLASLFLGSLHESAGRIADAESAYRQATAAEPLAQTARVALAHVLVRTGRRAEALAMLTPALDGSRPVPLTGDPFWIYPYADPSRSRTLLGELRRRVLR